MTKMERVKKCPKCGGTLVAHEFYSFSYNYKMTKKGILEKRGKKGEDGPIDCWTVSCEDCGTNWDADSVIIAEEGKVFLRDWGGNE